MPRVAVLVATYRRPGCLRRMAESLRGAAGVGVEMKVFVADNDADAGVAEVCGGLPVPCVYLALPGNPGCGAGLRAGMEAALGDAEGFTHFLVLDDDAVLGPECLDVLLAAMEGGWAEMVAPMILDERQEICNYAGPLPEPAWGYVRGAAPTREGYLAACGPGAVPFRWCPGVCLLVSRKAAEACGAHRADYWLMGEDLEFSLRVSHRFPALLVPEALAWHLPPGPPPGLAEGPGRAWGSVKGTAMLLNSAYSGSRLGHCRILLRHLPGNVLRYLRAEGWGARALADAARALWWGAARGRTAGSAEFQEFRRRRMAK